MSKFSYNKIYFLSWLVCIITLPWTIQSNSAAIILLVVISLAEGDYIKKWQRLKDGRWIIPFLIFFLLHVLALLYSQNMSAALFEVEKKLAFLVLPLVAATGPAPDAATWKMFNRGFVLSCLALCVVSIYFSLAQLGTPGAPHNFDVQTADNFHRLNPNASPTWEFFSYIQLGDWIDVHPAYFSMYLIFCCVLLLQDMHQENRIKVLNTALIGFFIFFIALLSSRIAILSLGATLIYLLRNIFKANTLRIAFGGACVLILCLMVFINPVSRYRIFQELITTSVEVTPSITQWNSVNLRMLEWKASVAGISNAWLTGVGPGDAQGVLNSYYSSFSNATSKLRYNCHNQYLQTTLELGVAGLFALIVCLFKPVMFSINPNPLFIAFIILFSLMCLTESMLARQKGIVFFTLFESLFLRTHFQK